MADPQRRWPQNVAGPLFVDEECIDCDLCRSSAPDNFARSDEGFSFVARQPSTPQEVTDCQAALEGCPVEAIGNGAAELAPSE